MNAAALLLIVGIDTFDALGPALELALVEVLGVVEQARKHQEGDLFDDRERVGDAAGPELGPEFIDFVFQFTCDHSAPVYIFV